MWTAYYFTIVFFPASTLALSVTRTIPRRFTSISAAYVPGKSAVGLFRDGGLLFGATYALNQAIEHRGLVETLPSYEPLARQPDPAPYLGTFARPNNRVVVRAEGAKMFVQEVPNNGRGGAEMPIAFFGPDRAVVMDGPERGQTIEFVRDASGKVNWVRVVGRVAVRVP